MKDTMRRLLAIIMSLMLLLCSLPVAAVADTIDSDTMETPRTKEPPVTEPVVGDMAGEAEPVTDISQGFRPFIAADIAPIADIPTTTADDEPFTVTLEVKVNDDDYHVPVPGEGVKAGDKLYYRVTITNKANNALDVYFNGHMEWDSFQRDCGGRIKGPKEDGSTEGTATYDFVANPSSAVSSGLGGDNPLKVTVSSKSSVQLTLAKNINVTTSTLIADALISYRAEVWTGEDKEAPDAMKTVTADLIMSNTFTVTKEISLVNDKKTYSHANMYQGDQIEAIDGYKSNGVDDGIRYWITIANMSNDSLKLGVSDIFTVNGSRDDRTFELNTAKGSISNAIEEIIVADGATDNKDGTITIAKGATAHLVNNSKFYTAYNGTPLYRTGAEITNSVEVWVDGQEEETKKTASVTVKMVGEAEFNVAYMYQIDEGDWKEFPEDGDVADSVAAGQKVRFKVIIENTSADFDGAYEVTNAFTAEKFETDESADTVNALEKSSSSTEGVKWEGGKLSVPVNGKAELISGTYTVPAGQRKNISDTIVVKDTDNGFEKAGTVALKVELPTPKFTLAPQYAYEDGVYEDLDDGETGTVDEAKKVVINGQDISYRIIIENTSDVQLSLQFEDLLLALKKSGEDTERVLDVIPQFDLVETGAQSLNSEPAAIALAEDADEVIWNSDEMTLTIPGNGIATLEWTKACTEELRDGDLLTLYYDVYETDTHATVAGALPILIATVDNLKYGRMHFEFKVVDREIKDGTEFHFTVVHWDNSAKENGKAAVFEKKDGTYIVSGDSNAGSGTVFTVPVTMGEDGFTATGSLDFYAELGEPYAIRPCDTSGRILKTEGDVTKGTEFITHSNGVKSDIVYSVCFADEDGVENNARATVHKPGDGNGGYMTSFTTSDFEQSVDWGKSIDPESDLTNYYLQDNLYIFYTAQYYYIQNYVADLDEAGASETEGTFAPYVTPSPNAYEGYVAVGPTAMVTCTDVATTPNPTPNAGNGDPIFTPAPALNNNRTYDQALKNGPTTKPEYIEDDPNDLQYTNLVYAEGTPKPSPTPKTDGSIPEFEGMTYTVEEPNKVYAEAMRNVNSQKVIPGDTIPVFWNRILKFARENDERNITVDKDFELHYGEKGYIRQRGITYDTHYVAWDGTEDVTGKHVEGAWKTPDEGVIDVTFKNNAEEDDDKALYALYAAYAEIVEDTTEEEAAAADVSASIEFSGDITEASQSVKISNIENASNVDLYLAPKVVVRYHLMKEENGEMVEDTKAEAEHKEELKDDTLYFLAPTDEELKDAVINPKASGKNKFFAKDTIVGYSYWHVSEGDKIGYYKIGEEVTITEDMVDFVNKEEWTGDTTSSELKYPVINLYAYEGVRLTIEKDVKDEGFKKGTFYFTVEMTDNSEEGKGETKLVGFVEVDDEYDYTYRVAGEDDTDVVYVLALRVDADNKKNALELFKLVEGKDYKYTIKEVSPARAKQLNSALSGEDDFIHTSGIDIAFEDYTVAYEWSTLKSDGSGEGKDSGPRTVSDEGVEITLLEGEKGTVTVYNTASFYFIKHYVADLSPNGSPRPAATNDPNKFAGYVPMQDENGEKVELTKATFAPAPAPSATPIPPTYAEVNQAFKTESAPEGGQITDHGIYTSTSSVNSENEANYIYSDLIYAGSTTPAPTPIAESFYDGKPKEVYVDVGKNSVEQLKTNEQYLKDNATDANNYVATSNKVKPGATVAVYWNRMLEFKLESDSRNVTAGFYEKGASKAVQQNGQKKNNIRQSQIKYDTEYVLWNLLYDVVADGSDAKAKIEDLTIMDSWQGYNTIDAQYKNGMSSTGNGYIFHSIFTQQMVTSNAADAAEVTDTLITADNTKGGSDGTANGTAKTKIYLTPRIMVRYFTREKSSDQWTQYNADTDSTIFTVSFTPAETATTAYKQTVNREIKADGQHPTSFAPVDAKTGYSSWRLYDWTKGTAVKSGTSYNFSDLINAAWKQNQQTKTGSDENGKILYIDLYSMGEDWLVEKSVTNADGEAIDVFAIGDTLYYTIKVTNLGGTELEGLKLKDKLEGITGAEPSDMKLSVYQTATAPETEDKLVSTSPFDPANNDTIALAVGQYALITYSYKVVNGDQKITNAATVGKDPDNDEEEGHTSTTETEVSNPAFELTKEVFGEADQPIEGPAIKNDVLTFVITVKNTGNVALRNLEVADVFSGYAADAVEIEVTRKSSLGASDTFTADGAWTYTIDTLAIGEVVTFTYTYTVDADDHEVLGNVATVTPDKSIYKDLEGDTADTSTDVAHLSVVKLPNKSITKDDLTSGAEVAFNIEVTNDGTVDLYNITVSDELADAKFEQLTDEDYTVSTDRKTATIAKLEAGGKVTLRVTYTVDVNELNPDGTLTNIADATGHTKENPDDPNDKTPEGKGEVTVGSIGYEVTKEVDNDTIVLAGEELTYTITIRNTGTVELEGLKISDVICGTSFVKAPKYSSAWKSSHGAKVDLKKGTIDVLHVGEVITITYVYTVFADVIEAGNPIIKNKVTVTPPAGRYEGLDDGGESAEVETPAAHLRVKKTTTSKPKNGKFYEEGETITYSIVVTNMGDFDLVNVKVTDSQSTKSGKVEWTIASLKAGESSKAFTFSHTVTAAEANGNYVANTAQATGITVSEIEESNGVQVTSARSTVRDLVGKAQEVTPNPTPVPGTVSISGRKTWVDNNDAAGIRPDSITVVVLQNGREYQTQVVTSANGWLYTFVNLPATDSAGNPYRYTIGERTVSGYAGHTEGFNLVNELMDDIEFDPNSQSGFVGSGLTEEQLESGAMLFDYGAELWSDLLETGDELPIYPFIFGGVGVAAVVALLVFGRRKKKEQ